MATTPLPRLTDKQTDVLVNLPEPDSRNKRQYEKLAELGLVFRVEDTYERKLLGDEVVEAINSGKDEITVPDPEPEPEEEGNQLSPEDEAKIKATLRKASLSEGSELNEEQQARALKPGNRTGETLRNYIMQGGSSSDSASSTESGTRGKHAVRNAQTDVIREMRTHLKWSADQWAKFTVADYIKRLERLIEQATAARDQVRQS